MLSNIKELHSEGIFVCFFFIVGEILVLDLLEEFWRVIFRAGNLKLLCVVINSMTIRSSILFTAVYYLFKKKKTKLETRRSANF